jgi:hypothetical protein
MTTAVVEAEGLPSTERTYVLIQEIPDRGWGYQGRQETKGISNTCCRPIRTHRLRRGVMRVRLARTRLFLISAVMALAIAVGGCVSFGVDSYEEFRSAVDSGATCEQLIDMQDNFAGTPDEARVADDLKDIGCDAPGSSRSDQ